MSVNLDSLDLVAARVWAETDRGVERGGLWSPEGEFLHLVNESELPEGRFVNTRYIPRRWRGGVFFHSHPRGGLPSRTDFEALESFEAWFGIRLGAVLAFREEGLWWWLFNKDEILESRFEG